MIRDIEGRSAMAAMTDFLRAVLDDGRVVHRGPPIPSDDDRPAAIEILAAAFAIHRLDVAGPPIPFEPGPALAAADLLRRATWFLLNRTEKDEVLERMLVPGDPPRSPSDHLSADLMLRFLPAIHRRARAVSAGDLLTDLLADVLRRWPLSGVLADLDDGPDDVGDFGGHPGLALLYAERLAGAEKPGWMPRRGLVLDQVTRVYRSLGREASPLLRPVPEPEEVPFG